MARVLFAQPNLQPPGGGQAVAAHLLRALLVAGHDVTTLTHTPVDVDAIDRHLGTDLAVWRDRLHRLEASDPAATLLRRLQRAGVRVSLDLLRSALLLRETRRRAGAFDLVVSAHNEWPVPGRSISYIHYPTRARPRPAADVRWFHARVALDGYYACADRLADFDSAAVRRQHLLVNSSWTNEVLHRTHGVRGTVLAPIVELESDAAAPAWETRAATFVCAGRFASEKRHNDVVAIVRGVRARGHDVRLLFVGHGSAADVDAVSAHARRHAFVEVRTNLDRTAYLACLRSVRFGLHAMHDEHFGIAPAEFIEAGCVCFGHNSGGVADVLGRDLCFDDVDDAVARIDAALRHPAELARLRAIVGARAGRYTRDRFEETFRAVVDDALNDRPPRAQR